MFPEFLTVSIVAIPGRIHSDVVSVSPALRSSVVERLILTSAEFHEGLIELLPHQLPVFLGRSETCDITINDGLLSRKHSEIRFNEAGRLEIRDLGSTNLTIVNERDIESHELKDGDIILLGETEIRVDVVSSKFDMNEQTTRDLTMMPGPGDETVRE